MFVLSIVGARPQFIKAAAVIWAIAEHNRESADCAITHKIIHTGQHYDDNMSKVFFDELEIPRPDYNLGVGSGPHGVQTGQMLERIEAVLGKEKPDRVLVYGDTNSTLAGALVAAKLQIPIAHVEAGLRSFNRRMPEEINRVLTDHVSDILFCPTETAVKNLANEGISVGIYLVGDVMYDCVLFYANKSKAIESDTLEKLNIRPKSYYLATVHRAENTDDAARLSNIVQTLNEVAATDCPVILPLHPRTVASVAGLGFAFSNNVEVIKPLSYLKMVALEKNAKLILTDSGGVQKEAYLLRVPCITLRDETEWVETVEAGWNQVVGAEKSAIMEAVSKADRAQTHSWEPIFGQGHSAEKICSILLSSTKALNYGSRKTSAERK